MTPDPRWLEILKASGWQTMAIAAASGVFLLIAYWGWVPALTPWMTQLAAFALLLASFLTIASIMTNAFKFFPVSRWVVHWINIHRDKKAVRDYIPHMTDREKTILGYLLFNNQKMFLAAHDGGYAATLLSRKIIILALQPGQSFTLEDTPMAIPDHVWDALQENRGELIKYAKRSKSAAHPWRVPLF